MALRAHKQLQLQDWMETNNGGFHDFSQSLQPHHQQQQQPQQFAQWVQIQSQSNPFLQGFSMGMPYATQSLLTLQVEKQRQEVDRFWALQNESLRVALQEQRKQQQLVLLRRLEFKTASLLKEKDEEIAKAARTSLELQDCVTKVEMENQAWQRVAEENETMVMTLNNTLEQIRESGRWSDAGGAEDAGSCFCESLSSSSSKEDKVRRKRMTCRACDARNSCVLFLPCRHLCCCKPCEALLYCCPVCKSVKKACIDVFMC